MICEHDLAEKETACFFDNLCPICLNTKLNALKKTIEKHKKNNRLTSLQVDMDEELYKLLEDL